MIGSFSIGKRYIWNEEVFEVWKLLSHNRVNILWIDREEYQTVSAVELATAQAEGDLRPEVPPDIAAIPRHLDWSDFTATERAVAEYRLRIIEPLIGLSGADLAEASDKRIVEISHSDHGADALQDSRLRSCSKVSIWRWLRSYRLSGADPRALVPKRRERSTEANRRSSERALEIARSTIEELRYKGKKRSTKSIWRHVGRRIELENQKNAAGEPIPQLSLSTVYRLVREIDTEHALLAPRSTKGKPRKARQAGQMEYPDWPLGRVEIDHTILDVVVVDDIYGVPLKRPTLTVMFDTATRYPLGYYLGFEPPSVLAVMSCLRHGILPKGDTKTTYGTQHDWIAYGIPSELVIDNGKEFVGADLEDACMQLGITLVRSPVKSPQFKAAVERFFGTLNTKGLHALPGTTFSNIDERGDYNSVKNASMTLSVLERVLVKLIVDVYAQDFHSGLKDKPADRWEELTSQGFFPQTRSAEELKFVLGRVDYRTLQHYGVEFENLRYNSPELAPLRVRYKHKRHLKFKIKYNPEDLGSIFLLDPDTRTYIEVPALRQTYAKGMNLWTHRAICARVRSKRKRVNDRAIAEAEHEIREEVQQSLADTKTRKRMHAKTARLMGSRGMQLDVSAVSGNLDLRDDRYSEDDFAFTDEELSEVAGELAPHPGFKDAYWSEEWYLDDVDDLIDMEDADDDGWNTDGSVDLVDMDEEDDDD